MFRLDILKVDLGVAHVCNDAVGWPPPSPIVCKLFGERHGPDVGH